MKRLLIIAALLFAVFANAHAQLVVKRGPIAAAAGGGTLALRIFNETGKSNGNTTFADQSVNNFTITAGPATNWVTGTPGPDGVNASVSFVSGSVDRAIVPCTTACSPGSGDFYMGGFFLTSASSGHIMGWRGGGSDRGVMLYVNGVGTLVFYASSVGSSHDIFSAQAAGSFTSGAWRYIAVMRIGNDFCTAVGALGGSTTITAIGSSASAIHNAASPNFTVGWDQVNGDAITINAVGVEFYKGGVKPGASCSSYTVPSLPLS